MLYRAVHHFGAPKQTEDNEKPCTAETAECQAHVAVKNLRQKNPNAAQKMLRSARKAHNCDPKADPNAVMLRPL